MKKTNPDARVSMVGALPPFKGNAYYSMSLARAMSNRVTVDFIAFKKLYPEFLYSGGVSDHDPCFVIAETDTLRIRKLINYANPWSWIRSGFAIVASLVHLQWWSIPLAPIYIVILGILKLRRKRIIITVHNVIPHEASVIDRIATRTVLGFADGLIVHSEDNREGLITHFGLAREIIHKVHMPVHDMYGGKELDRLTARRQAGVPLDGQIILSFGNLRDYKGIDCLIEAFAQVRNSVPSAHLLIVGQPWSRWDECESLIRALDLQGQVTTVLEYVPMSAVAKYFIASDVVALPYRRFDAQSGVGNIALAYSLPLVVSRVGGLPDLVMDDRVTVEPNDTEQLAKVLSAVLTDESLVKKLRADARVLRNRYSWAGAVGQTLAIYDQVERVQG